MMDTTERRIPIEDLLVFHQLARSLTSSFDLDKILRTILENMERFIDADLWTLLMLELWFRMWIDAPADAAVLRPAA